MAKYRLEALLSARKIKEDSAARVARAAGFAVTEAKDRLEEAKLEYERYRLWRPQEEEKRFVEIRTRVLPQTDLDDYRAGIEALRQKELELEDAIETAKQAVLKAEEAEREAKRLLVVAARDKEKIAEHRKRWLREELKRQAEAEEKEMEDFTSRSLLEDEEAEGGLLEGIE